MPRNQRPAAARARTTRPARLRRRRLIGKRVVMDRCGISFPTIWRMMTAGTFPSSVAVGGKRGWYEDEVDAWINSRPRAYQPEA
jgi:predicted DNA-binding transcriptional regulator AlpA